jgi:hypothetical protein
MRHLEGGGRGIEFEAALATFVVCYRCLSFDATVRIFLYHDTLILSV